MRGGVGRGGERNEGGVEGRVHVRVKGVEGCEGRGWEGVREKGVEGCEGGAGEGREKRGEREVTDVGKVSMLLTPNNPLKSPSGPIMES